MLATITVSRPATLPVVGVSAFVSVAGPSNSAWALIRWALPDLTGSLVLDPMLIMLGSDATGVLTITNQGGEPSWHHVERSDAWGRGIGHQTGGMSWFPYTDLLSCYHLGLGAGASAYDLLLHAPNRSYCFADRHGRCLQQRG